MGADLNLTRHRFDNGLTLLISENQRLPLVSLNAFVLAGADQNPFEKAGTAELTSRLLDEGSVAYSASQLNQMIEGEGGTLSIFSHREMTGLRFQARSPSVETGLQVLFELLARPIFPQEAFQLEKENLLSDLHALEDEPTSIVSKLLNHHIYPESPLGFPPLGTLESVTQMRRRDVIAFHRAKYSPDNTILIAVGDVQPSAFNEMVGQTFGKWRNPDYRREVIAVPQPQSKPVSEEVSVESEQVQIAVGHLGITRLNPDFHSLQVLDLILGSGPGFTSRIPRVLRDELGLAYLTYGSITASAGIYPGVFVGFVSTSPHNRREALGRLLEETVEIIAGRYSDEEMETAQDYLTGNFVFDFESNDNVARFLLSTELFGLGVDYPERYSRIIRGVTRADINRVAAQYLDMVNCTTVVVGPHGGPSDFDLSSR